MKMAQISKLLRTLGLLGLMLAPMLASAAETAVTGLPAVTVTTGPGGGQTYSLTLQVLILMTVLSLLPAILLMMTAFTRIIIVLAILRQAIGAGQTPPNQVLVGLALFLTFFVMSPVIDKVNTEAAQPYLAGTIETTVALERAIGPIKGFMLEQTRETDIATFVRISGGKGFAKPADVPLSILVPSFVTSELKTAFQIGFLLFIPFVIIDLVVASVLMSMGMMMLSPVLISLPFKIMLFVLIDGWSLVMGTLAESFFSMTPEMVVTIGRHALEVTLMLSAPLLLTALAVGLIVGIFQAATSINEMTLSFIPKLLAMAAVLAIAGPWMIRTLVEYSRGLIESIPGMVG